MRLLKKLRAFKRYCARHSITLEVSIITTPESEPIDITDIIDTFLPPLFALSCKMAYTMRVTALGTTQEFPLTNSKLDTFCLGLIWVSTIDRFLNIN